MYKIKNIRLNNFKFFFGEQNLKLDKKHTLIYGENGSGKSSIYWALHCFLHSTLKPNVESVQKYFLPISQSEESVKNRYAQDADKSGVSITLEHLDYERYANINAEISNNVVNTQTNHEIKLMALSSELINYKVVYNMYLATNKSTIKLFSYFEKNLLEFIDFDQELNTIYGAKISRNSLDWWRYIKKGMQPYTTMQDPNYGTFQGHVALFNQKLSDYLQLVTRETNRSLQEDFNEDFTIKFKYTQAVYNGFKYGEDGQPHGRTKATKAPEIELIVELPNVGGISSTEVKRPHSYLNEARLSAIAIAIRLAILKERYIEQAPKVMVLDDLLLSLDLGNRSALLKIILKNYASRFQLIILTHDRVFFDTVLKHIPEDKQKSDWRILEMYETESGDKKVPKVVTYQSSLSKAYAYFKGENHPIDYNACGNNQRQALEEIFKTQFKAYTLKNENNEVINVDGFMLRDCIAKAKEMYTKIGFGIDLLDELDIHRVQSLNPSSHHNPQSNFYKSEIKRTFEIINLLQEHKIFPLIPKDDIITFSINCDDNSTYDYEVKILDDILVYKKPESQYYPNLSDKRKYVIEKCNGKKAGHTTNVYTLKELYDDTCGGLVQHLNKNPLVEDNVLNIFKFNGKSLNVILDEINN